MLLYLYRKSSIHTAGTVSLSKTDESRDGKRAENLKFYIGLDAHCGGTEVCDLSQAVSSGQYAAALTRWGSP